jgi:SDR family mycofactocin-dependent oxidoreductase
MDRTKVHVRHVSGSADADEREEKIVPKMQGKVALITGGARGQGRSHALTLAREGADIILFDIAQNIDQVQYDLARDEDLEGAASAIAQLGRDVITVRGDTRRREDLDTAVSAGIERYGKIDVLVANAGIWDLAKSWEMTQGAWQTVIDVNLTGTWNTVCAVIPHMIRRRQGSIILTSSVSGIEASPGHAHYAASKAGVISLTRSLAVELGPYAIRCNSVAPGLVDTQMNTWQGALDMMAGHSGGTAEDRIAAGPHWGALPHGMIQPQAISNAVLYLASDDAADVTGTILNVDAGHMALGGFNTTPGPAVEMPAGLQEGSA